MLPVARPDFDESDLAAVAAAFESRWLGPGPIVDRFEAALRERIGAEHVTAVATGTAALHVGLLALGVGPGDEVVVPSFTFVATPQAVTACGATPVFADADPASGSLDLASVRRLVTPRTRAVLPVHYGGQVSPMQELEDLTAGAGLHLVEDAAHSFGSTDRGASCGSLSEVACFSFDPIKSLTCGQGGAVVARDPEVAERALALSDLGIRRSEPGGEYDVVGPGLRYRMSDLNAAIGLSQLERFDQRAARRREVWKHYADAFDTVGGLRILDHRPDEMVPFLFAVLVEGDREPFREELARCGVSTGTHYRAAHLHAAFRRPGECLPAAETLSQRVVTLPFYPSLSDEDVEHVIRSVHRAAGSIVPTAPSPNARRERPGGH